jgi:hypothetical protein
MIFKNKREQKSIAGRKYSHGSFGGYGFHSKDFLTSGLLLEDNRREKTETSSCCKQEVG